MNDRRISYFVDVKHAIYYASPLDQLYKATHTPIGNPISRKSDFDIAPSVSLYTHSVRKGDKQKEALREKESENEHENRSWS